MPECKVIYSMRVMLALVNKGFQPKSIMPNPRDPQYNCWIYELTPELQEALDEIFGGDGHE